MNAQAKKLAEVLEKQPGQRQIRCSVGDFVDLVKDDNDSLKHCRKLPKSLEVVAARRLLEALLPSPKVETKPAK